MIRRSLVVLVLVAAVSGGCDSSSEGDRCPTPSAAGKAHYFPLEVGLARSFDYTFLVASTSTERTEGVLTWQVVAAAPCQSGTQVFTVEEMLTGETRITHLSGLDVTSPVSRSRTLEFAVDDSVIYPGPYFHEGLSRFHPLDAPDTIEVALEDPQSIYGFDNNRGWSASVRLVRGQGLVSRSFFYHGGVVYDVWEDLILSEPGSKTSRQ